MKDKALDTIDKIIDIIKNSDEYEKYIDVSNKLQKNKEVMALINDIKDLQKQIVRKKHNNMDTSLLEKKYRK